MLNQITNQPKDIKNIFKKGEIPMSNLNGAKLKNLQVIQTKTQDEIAHLKKEQKLINQEIHLKLQQLQSLDKEISKLMQSNTLTVSEHAIIRYLQRVYKLDLKKIEQEILTDDIKKQVKLFGSGTFKSEDFSVKVKDNVVVTILED